MGLSTTYANLVMFTLTATVLFVLMATYSQSLIKLSPEIDAARDHLAERVDTSVQIASVTTSVNDVIVYAVNNGKSDINLNCTDFYLDRTYVARDDIDELTVLNTSIDPGIWNPTEWMKMRTEYETDDGQPHELRLVTCNGHLASAIFYNSG